MQARTVDVERLRRLEPAARRALLLAESGLPGPRANLPLAHAVAEAVGLEEARSLLADRDPSTGSAEREFLALCGALALASRADPAARDAARDARWRVREGVALGLQVLGARDPMGFSEVLDHWRDDPDPLVQRARLAAVGEPPLLRDPALAALALEVCEQATAFLRDAADRRAEGVRVLRQALGWAWSVVVAADPDRGLPAFRTLEEDLPADPDVAWIVRSNRGKARLARLLDRSS